MAQPQYGTEHERARRAYLAAYAPGQPCARCGKPMWPPVRLLDLDHATDEQGRRYVPARYLGLSHRKCNRAAKPDHLAGSGASRQERDAREARRSLREGRAEFDRVQAALTAEEAPGRDW